MSFSFGFSGDDIDDEGQDDDHGDLAHEISKTRISDLEQSNTRVLPPKRHSFKDLLASLPSQISYNTLRIALQKGHGSEPPNEMMQHENFNETLVAKIYRRSLFDIRAQLMAEANPSTTDEPDSAETLLAGLENGDLSSGIYEGGFKTWECAMDLASMLTVPSSPLFQDGSIEQDWEVIELGAGSAIPGLAVLAAFLRRKTRVGRTQAPGSLKLTLCDYNADVLRLATVPNVFLNYLFLTGRMAPQQVTEDKDEGDLDLEELGGETFTNAVMKEILAEKISLDLISGRWGDDFVDLIITSSSQSVRSVNLLILASETIYSPSSIKPFARTLLTLLKRHQQRGGPAKAWIAAKKVYFGVGGGVDEFEREIASLGGTSKVIFETKDTGVGRVILQVTSIP
ncbi:hypothetical protein H2200_001704 [Cladophialophora chaetospira]|uniref:protein-histidine N-methyltransferase n=1 Tax=Cladophialophora chaetospira TaxID=386627 RepID=A0AA38XLD6_9EURO|nr:hypothetical protein H2200_001704 [Cladophialophora chaetospira]